MAQMNYSIRNKTKVIKKSYRIPARPPRYHSRGRHRHDWRPDIPPCRTLTVRAHKLTGALVRRCGMHHLK